MKADDAKGATEMLSLFNKEVNYFPIIYDVNYTRMDYILCKLRLSLGIDIPLTNRRIDKVMKREIRKYFGDAEFDYVIHHSEFDRMVGSLCILLSKKTMYNFKYFNYEKYKGKGRYRKQVKYFLKRFPNYTMVVATKEINTLGIKADNITINEETILPMDKLLKEMTQN
jgi:hypothetical protein